MGKKNDNKIWFIKGLKMGIPIGLGYFAVSFALGIMAKKSGLTAFLAAATSALCNASAGEYAGFTVIASDAPYLEMALITLIINARYMLMSTALSQKLDEKMKFFHRFFIAHYITDEIFAASVTVPGNLNPFYTYGMAAVAGPSWALGTAFGVMMDSLLPDDIAKALGVCLYGMFLAIIIPPAKKNRVIAGLIILSFALSFAFSIAPIVRTLSEGTRIIILTVALSLLAAIFFPVEDDTAAEAAQEA